MGPVLICTYNWCCALHTHREAQILTLSVSEISLLSLNFYYLFFVFLFYIDDRLYIVMELIEGAPLGEHFSSLKEKQLHFTEERLWKIFIQVHFYFH